MNRFARLSRLAYHMREIASVYRVRSDASQTAVLDARRRACITAMVEAVEPLRADEQPCGCPLEAHMCRVDLLNERGEFEYSCPACTVRFAGRRLDVVELRHHHTSLPSHLERYGDMREELQAAEADIVRANAGLLFALLGEW